VFAGITMFGFLGIIIGPVLMIVIVTTISVYLAVYKGVPLNDEDDENDDHRKKPGRLRMLLDRIRKRGQVEKSVEKAAVEDAKAAPAAD
jgi:hypothetical protein